MPTRSAIVRSTAWSKPPPPIDRNRLSRREEHVHERRGCADLGCADGPPDAPVRRFGGKVSGGYQVAQHPRVVERARVVANGDETPWPLALRHMAKQRVVIAARRAVHHRDDELGEGTHDAQRQHTAHDAHRGVEGWGDIGVAFPERRRIRAAGLVFRIFARHLTRASHRLPGGAPAEKLRWKIGDASCPRSLGISRRPSSRRVR